MALLGVRTKAQITVPRASKIPIAHNKRFKSAHCRPGLCGSTGTIGTADDVVDGAAVATEVVEAAGAVTMVVGRV